MMKISPNKEDYIKAIHSLNGTYEIVSNKSIAKELSVSAASVTDMNTRLVKEQLITHIPYKGVKLTDYGIQVANQLLRKHRIWEVFLYEKLGFKWDEVHHEADRLEHASSDKMIERLNEFLDYPKYDPHGGMIPNIDGTLDDRKAPLLSLADIQVDDVFIVKEVSDEDVELLHYLFDKGFSINDKYQLVDSNTYDGMVTIKDLESDKQLTISGKAIEQINIIKI